MKFIQKIDETINFIANTQSAVEHYEAALTAVFLNNNYEEAWECWNLARLFLSEDALKKEGEQ